MYFFFVRPYERTVSFLHYFNLESEQYKQENAQFPIGYTDSKTPISLDFLDIRFQKDTVLPLYYYNILYGDTFY